MDGALATGLSPKTPQSMVSTFAPSIMTFSLASSKSKFSNSWLLVLIYAHIFWNLKIVVGLTLVFEFTILLLSDRLLTPRVRNIKMPFVSALAKQILHCASTRFHLELLTGFFVKASVLPPNRFLFHRVTFCPHRQRMLSLVTSFLWRKCLRHFWKMCLLLAGWLFF